MHYFPSKKVVAVAVFALGVLAWVMFDSSSLSNLTNGVRDLLQVAESSSALPDSDNDGLFDWQETLLGTNENNSDSDNDGVLDGEQYASFKNIPNIKPTDDVLNYLSQLGNAAIDGGTATSLPEPTLVIPPDFYGNRDINTTHTDAETAGQYIIQFVTVLGRYPNVFDMDPLTTISHWLETNDKNDMVDLQKMGAELKALSSDLSEIVVPVTFLDSHLTLINSLYAEGGALDDVKITNQNPVQGFLSASIYANFRSKRADAIVQITQLTNEFTES